MAMIILNICRLLCILLFYLPTWLLSGQVIDDEDPLENMVDVTGVPIVHQFKVTVAAGDTDCFYQKLRVGARVLVTFQVLRGADTNIGLSIKGPNGSVVEEFDWTNKGATRRDVEVQGVHAFCLSNALSRFSSKLVYIRIMTLVVKDTVAYHQNTIDYVDGIANFSVYLQSMDLNVGTMSHLQDSINQHSVYDWYLLSSSSKYVQNVSIVMSTLIIAVAVFQVCFVRRLFRPTTTGPTKSKARA